MRTRSREKHMKKLLSWFTPFALLAYAGAALAQDKPKLDSGDTA